MGCLRSIGTGVVIVVLLVVAWFYRGELAGLLERDRAPAAASAEPEWAPLTTEGAARARAVVNRLSRRSGRVYENVQPADLSALVFEELSRQALPPSTTNAEAAAIGSALAIRADVRLSDFGARDVLGPLASMLDDTERVQFGGVLEVVRPGLAQYRVTSLQIGKVSVPPPLIPRLIKRLGTGTRPEGIGEDALPLEIPDFIGDVRVSTNAVTLIKAAK